MSKNHKDKIFDKFVDLCQCHLSSFINIIDFCVVNDEFRLLSKGRYVKGFGAAYDLRD